MDNLDYWELRKMVIKIVPRSTILFSNKRKAQIVKEKGRKKNYSQFNLKESEWRKQERLLNTEEINSFLEISTRAAACPMPFNMDIWDGLVCPFACIYCYANSFRASLYTAFFDNSKTMGFRHMNPDKYKLEMDKMGAMRALSFEKKKELSGINKAFALDIPVRMGIRFEDFLNTEKRNGVSLTMLKYLSEIEYPVMVNTKSALIGTEPYVKALASNKAKTAVHVTAITSNEEITRAIEPGSPKYKERLAGVKNMVAGGIRVVARIEPYLFLITDDPDDIEQYMTDMWDAGVRNITFDTYSYTANNSGIRQSFMNAGFDYDRMFLAGADSQPLGSLLLEKFMDLFRVRGFSCSTFDMGNVPANDQSICCEVGDWFEGGFNYGSTVYAARFIVQRGLKKTTWKDFEKFVDDKGGFLTDTLKLEVKGLWNLGGNFAYSHSWAQGLTPVGRDADGVIWIYKKETDNRIKLIQELL